MSFFGLQKGSSRLWEEGAPTESTQVVFAIQTGMYKVHPTQGLT